MPYSSIDELPKQTDKLSDAQKRKFMRAFNSAIEDNGEESAFRIAWSTVSKFDPSSYGMICLLPSEDNGAIDVDDDVKLAHVTLCFLGRGDEVPDNPEKVLEKVAQYLPIEARVAGVGRLGSEDPPATVLFLNGDDLTQAHEAAFVEGAPDQFKPFMPHLTMGYGLEIEDLEDWMGKTISLDRVAFVRGDEVVSDVSKSAIYAETDDQEGPVPEMQISKLDDDKMQAFGWASVASLGDKQVVDLQGDSIDIEELEKSAYSYVLNSRVGGVMHERITKADEPKEVGRMIESFVFTPEKIAKLGLPEDTPQGWWIGFQVNDEKIWKDIKGGKYTAFSIHGKGKRDTVMLSDEDLSKYAMWVGDVAKSTELHYSVIEDELCGLLSKAGLELTDGNLVDLVKALADEVGHEESVERISKHLTSEVSKASPDVADLNTGDDKSKKKKSKLDERAKRVLGRHFEIEDEEKVGKHLIGNHDQEDHDPNKDGKFHSRKKHTAESEQFGTLGAGLGAVYAGARGAALGGTKGALIGGLSGALGGGSIGYQFGGEKLLDNPTGNTAAGFAAGLGNIALDPLGTALRQFSPYKRESR